MTAFGVRSRRLHIRQNLTLNRIHDARAVEDALLLYPFGEIKLDVAEWMDNPVIILSDEDGNLGLFEEYYDHVYTGHYFYKTGGKYARNLAIEMLREIFTKYGAEAVRGLTPVEHKAALWMTRHLGFKSYAQIDTRVGPCVLFVMTKAEFEGLYE